MAIAIMPLVGITPEKPDISGLKHVVSLRVIA